MGAEQLTNPPLPAHLAHESRPVAIAYGARTLTVKRPLLHPADRLELHGLSDKGGHYVIGHWRPGMTRGDVKRLAWSWIGRRERGEL